MTCPLSDKDLHQITKTGQTPEKIQSQLKLFSRGTPFIALDRACTPGDGIKILKENQIRKNLDRYASAAPQKTLVKFVPASGAATRMFKNLIKAHDALGKNQPPPDTALLSFLGDNCRRFAFYTDLKASLADRGMDLDALIAGKNMAPVLRHLLTDAGLGYAALPKGLIKFHSYPERHRTAFEEHLVEADGYARSETGACVLHFTVPAAFKDRFMSFSESIRDSYENSHGVRFHISFSTQSPGTDTIAVDMDNQPFRLPDGSLLFRPGGHGALIENLNQVDADIIFIKNVDNVAHDRFSGELTKWKKILCGEFIRLQQQIFDFLRRLHEKTADASLTTAICDFLQKELQLPLPKNFHSQSNAEKQQTLVRMLDRPLRVCGMVPNTGDPGGGPFWVKNRTDYRAPQIVESAQINLDAPDQRAIVNRLAHFNPVDLVCGVRNWQGKKFNLLDYVDNLAVFITTKSQNGRDLKALELPGLWNGAMAYWNSVFVEVPKITFNPVKEVTDLLDPHHQPAP